MDKKAQSDKLQKDRAKWRVEAEQEKRKLQERLEELRIGRPPKFSSPVLFAVKIAEYFNNCDNGVNLGGKTEEQAVPATQSGMLLHIRLSSDNFYIYLQGERDSDTYTSSKDIDKISDVLLKSGDTEGILMYTCLLLSIDTIDTHISTREESLNTAELLVEHADLVRFSSICNVSRTLLLQKDEERLRKRGAVGDIFVQKAVHKWTDGENVRSQTLVLNGDSAISALEKLGYKQLK